MYVRMYVCEAIFCGEGMLVEYAGLPVLVPETVAEQKGRLISQGAEALVFELEKENSVVKYRPAKPWRLPELDEQLRTRRTTQEARVMQKLLQSGGIGVPKLKYYDAKNGVICMELIQGKSLKQKTWDCEGELSLEVRKLYATLGEMIAKMHAQQVMHGDLTTSNAMVTPNNELKLIDFGLSAQRASVDDKAVDLYVLERAITSTHPLEKDVLMDLELLPAYFRTAEELGENVPVLQARLEKTRAGGRKRTGVS